MARPIFRAFHALPPLTNSEGQPTGAIRGGEHVVASAPKLPGEPLAVILDAPGKTVAISTRITRPTGRPWIQISGHNCPLHEVIRAHGFPLIMVLEVEAGDALHPTRRCWPAAGGHFHLDKDLAQLVTAQVTLVNTMTDTILDRAGVREKFGVDLEQIIDLLAPTGDSR